MDYKEILAIFDTKGLENDHELCSVFEKAKEAAQAHMRDVHRAREQIRSQLHDAREAGKLTVDGFEHYLPALIPSGTTVDHFEDEGSYIVVRSSPEECLIDMFRSGTCKDWMFVKNREHEYIYANRIMEEDLGLHESGIEGHTDYDFYDESSVGRLESLDQQVIKGNSVSQVHTRDARGQRRTFLDVLVPWRDENGFVIGVLGISRDVTAHYNERVSAGEFQKEDYSSGAMTRVIP
ncbi:MAG: PAS domain-containing protein, partial [Deltaproteobacteria bacterium]|nr:PAS domain-containing protein [Deltaproteobacteria bacterium]